MELNTKIQEADRYLEKAINALQESIYAEENRYFSLSDDEIDGDTGTRSEQDMDDVQDIILRLQFIRAELQPRAEQKNIDEN